MARVTAAPSADRVRPIEVVRLPQTDGERVAQRRAAGIGADALAAGEVGVILVAGGSGTRLGFEGPKGTFPIGPVSSASLFQIHAEKIVALGRRFGRPIPLYIMTSPENHQATVDFFQAHDQFGLEHVRFFVQGQMPAVDRATGKVLLATKDQVALSPDGHGGTLAALAAPGPDGTPSCLDEMRERGVRTLFYFQVDNPLVRDRRPGLHRPASRGRRRDVVQGRRAALARREAGRGRARRRPSAGDRVLRPSRRSWPAAASPRAGWSSGPAASPSISWSGRSSSGWWASIVSRSIGPSRRFRTSTTRANSVKPGEPNAVKFEQFIFDALPMASRWTIVETDRAGEFEPLKNAVGPDSPATVHQRMSDQFGSWLEQAGAMVPRTARRLGPLRHRDQPAVRPRRGGAEVEDRAGPGRRAADLSPLNRSPPLWTPLLRSAMLHAIIMAGGSGTRFWPKSRRDRPKQLLRLAGESTMLQQTVARIEPLVPPDRIVIVTGADQAEATRAQLPDLPAGNVVAEPCPRDTAPCVGLAAGIVASKDPEGTMIVMPADHVIEPVEAFRTTLHAAVSVIDDDPGTLVTFGITPTRPETGYGYIERGPLVEQSPRHPGLSRGPVPREARPRHGRAVPGRRHVPLELGDLRLACTDHPGRTTDPSPETRRWPRADPGCPGHPR